jgi:hypothetical protein
MRVLICGDRNWTDRESIDSLLATLPRETTTIIHGNAKGADRIAGEIAEGYGMDVEFYPAMWNLYGRAAGPKRNAKMLEKGRPEYIVYYHADLASSKGTRNMVNQAREAGLPVLNGLRIRRFIA